MTGLDQQQVYALIAQTVGQANILTIPRLFINWTGDHVSALLLSQVIYWSSRTNDPEGWFYKSAKEWQEELAISDFQLNRATKRLVEAGLETKLRKVSGAPTLHYRLDQATFIYWISEKLGNGNPRNSEMDLPQTGNWIPELVGNGLPKSLEMDIPETRRSLTETTTEINRQRPIEASKGFHITLDERATIGRYMEDLAREFRDEAPLSSSTTRACRLYVAAGIELDVFLDAMLEARRKTQERSGGIKKLANGGKSGEKSKMSYWFAVLADLMTAASPVGPGELR